MTTDTTERQLETATLGGGCFWCLEAVFGRLEGVEKVAPGHAGGRVPDPSYELGDVAVERGIVRTAVNSKQ